MQRTSNSKCQNPTKEGAEGKTRLWTPKCRASTLGDRRTKRNRTRSDRDRRAVEDNS